MNDPRIPVIRLEIEGVKHAILRALSERELSMDQYVSEALDRVCDPDHLRSLVLLEAEQAINKAVTEEVKRYFEWGEGREAIREAVIARMRAAGIGGEVGP